MKELSRKSAKLILNVLESVQKESKVLVKTCQKDKNCNLETYENTYGVKNLVPYIYSTVIDCF